MCGEVWQIWTSGYRDSLDLAIWEYHPGETFLARGAWGGTGEAGREQQKGKAQSGRAGGRWPHTLVLSLSVPAVPRGSSLIVAWPTGPSSLGLSSSRGHVYFRPVRTFPCTNGLFFSFSFKSTWVNRRLNETNSKAELTTHVLLPFRVSEWVSSSVHRNRTHPLQRTTSIDFLLLSLSLHYSTVNRRTRSSKVRRERSQVSSIRLSARRVGD